MPEDRSGTPADRLDARYGRRPRSRTSRRLPAVIAAVVGVVVLLGWAIWTGFGGIFGTTELQTLTYDVRDDRTVSVSWSVTGDQGSRLLCAVQAQAEDRSVVGLVVVEVPPSTAPERTGTTEVRTVRAAVTGLLSSCRRA